MDHCRLMKSDLVGQNPGLKVCLEVTSDLGLNHGLVMTGAVTPDGIRVMGGDLVIGYDLVIGRLVIDDDLAVGSDLEREAHRDLATKKGVALVKDDDLAIGRLVIDNDLAVGSDLESEAHRDLATKIGVCLVKDDDLATSTYERLWSYREMNDHFELTSGLAASETH